MPTDTIEKGLETRTCNLLMESGWLPGENKDYTPASCVDLAHLAAFLQDTQPETARVLYLDSDDNTRRQFLRCLHPQEPILNPARFEWHEVSKVQHYWLQVDAMTRPMKVEGHPNPE